MSEQSFTPGPWFTFDNRDLNDAIWIGPAMFVSIAEVRMGSDDIPGDVEANARLIAAAPALLEALKSLIPINAGNPAASIPDDQALPVDMTVGEVRKALAAISQAEGRGHG